MNALKLTAYFGERSRYEGRLWADEMLDVHARHEIHASILLRGIQGFGAKHRRRTDRLLTLSEDLPVVSIAIDEPAKIETLAQEIGAIGHSGLLTLERLQLLGDKESVTVGGGETLKLTIHLGRHQRIDGSPAFAALCELLHARGIAGATVMLGVDGTRSGVRERAKLLARNARVPMMIVAVGDARLIDEVLPDLRRALPDSLLTIERVAVCKRDGQRLDVPAPPTSTHGERWRKLTIVTSEAARHEGRPVYLEIVKQLRAAHCAGATALRGIWGYHGDHAPHGDRLLSIRRHVPVAIEAIDTEERIATLFAIVDDLTRERGLVTSETLPRPPFA